MGFSFCLCVQALAKFLAPASLLYILATCLHCYQNLVLAHVPKALWRTADTQNTSSFHPSSALTVLKFLRGLSCLIKQNRFWGYLEKVTIYFSYSKEIHKLLWMTVEQYTRLSPFLCHSVHFLILESFLEWRMLASLLVCFNAWSLRQSFSVFSAVLILAFPHSTSNGICKLQYI